MGMTALATAAIGLLAGGGQAIMANQAAQHAKGAAQAQQTAMDAQIAEQKKADETAKKTSATNVSATHQAALAALKASMSTQGALGGTILTGPSGAGPAPTGTKTLLGT